MVSRTPKRIHRVVMTLAVVTLLVTAVASLSACQEEPVKTAAEFHLYNLQITPHDVQVGQQVTISYRVENSGGAGGTYLVSLNLNGTVYSQDDLSHVIGLRLPRGFLLRRISPTM